MNDPNKNRELTLFLTFLMMMLFFALMLGGAIAGFIVIIGEVVRTWFK